MADFPKSYQDPLYADLDAKTEEKLGLPVGLLSSVRVRGERSNHDQTNSLGTSSVYQFIPATRKAILDKYGLDVTLNPQNASEGAGLLLKEGLERNKGDASQAVGEYIGGLNRSNWGPQTKAYINRVMTGQNAAKTSALENDFAKFMASNPAVPAGRSTSATPPAAATTEPAATGALEAGFAQYLQANPTAAPAAEAEPMNFLERTREAVTGTARRTAETDALPDWATMPELNSMSIASAKTGLGTLLSNPAETAQIIKANFPGAQVRQDDKGNFLIRSAADGKEYAIKPGFQVSDIPRAVGALAAFTPAGRAATIPGAAVGAGLTQAVIEGSQAATGGQFNPGEVAMATAAGGIVPAVARAGGAVIDAGKSALARMRGVPEPAVNPAQVVREAAAAAPETVPPVEAPVAPVVAPTPAAGKAAATGPVAGDEMVWRNASTDIPVRFKHVEPQAGPDGRMYARVEVNGRESFVPADELVPAAKPSAPAASAPAAPATPPVTAPAASAAAPAAPAAPAVVPMAAADLAQTARTAAEGGMGSSRATRVLADQAAPDAATVSAAKRLGIEDHLQPDHVTTNQAFRELAQAVKSIPGSEARAAEMQGLEKIGQRADDLISEIGGTTDASTLSSTVKARMQATQTELEKQADDLYAKVREAIPPKTAAPVENTLGFLSKHADEVGGAARLLPTERKLLATLNGEDGPITYALLDQTRKQIGQAMRKANGPFADSESGLLKKLYSTLSADQAAVAEAAGAGGLYKAAQASVAVRKGLEDDLVSIFGKALDNSLVSALSGAVRALPQGDASKLVRLVASVPQDLKQQVVASGVASAFRTAGTRGPINFTTYAKWYEGLLRNKQAYAAVMSNLPLAARKQLSDLYRVSKGISAASRERITTGRIQAVMDEFKGPDNLAGRLYETAKRSAVGATAGTAAGAVMGPGVGAAVASALTRGAKPNAIKAADALIASPEFAQLARRGGNQAAKVRRFAYSQPFTRYVRAVGSPRELSNREKWVMQVLQGRNNSQD